MRKAGLRREWSVEVALLIARLESEPDNALFWGQLGALNATVGHWDDSCRAYRRATRLDEESYSNWEGLCMSALAAQQLPFAERAAAELRTRFPMRAGSHLVVGHIHKARGRAAEAIQAYQRALAIDPGSSAALFNLVDMSTPQLADPLGASVLKMAERVDLNDFDSVNVLHAAGRIHEAAGNIGAAFDAFQHANLAGARIASDLGRAYDVRSTEQQIERTMAAHPSPSVQPAGDENRGGVRLIFIVGMPRSGTTLVEQILGSHPRVAAGGELPIASECERIYNRRRQERGMAGPIDRSNPVELEIVADVREMYLDRLLDRDIDAEFVTDKLPGNFLRLGFVRLIFPDAILVHCRRHPVATCWSLFASNFAAAEPQYHSLEHLAHYYGCYSRLMGHWDRTMVPAPVEVSYEALVAAPEQQIRQLVAAVGLDWDDRCNAFHESRRPVLTASHLQVRAPIYTQSVERWRSFAPHLGPLLSLGKDDD